MSVSTTSEIQYPLAASRARSTAMKGLRAIALRLILPAALLAVWAIASWFSAGEYTVLPPPWEVLSTIIGEASTGILFYHIGTSLLRAMAGFAIGGLIGITVGLAMSQFLKLKFILGGPIELLRPISPIAWIPLAILWFGLGYKSVVFVIVLSCLFVVLLNTLDAASRFDPNFEKAARTLGANRMQTFLKVRIPNSLPGIMLGLRVAMSAAWGGVLVAEMIASQEGVGYMIVRAQSTFDPALVIGGMVVVGLVGYLLNAAFVAVERRVLHV